MLQNGFDIVISDEVVSVREDSSTDEGAGWISGILTIGFAVVLFALSIFLPGRNETPSVWDGIQTFLSSSGASAEPIAEAVLVACLCGFVFLWGLRFFFPSGESFTCNRGTFTLSRIPKLNLTGAWKTQAFRIGEIAQFRYAVTVSGRGGSLWGFRYHAAGKSKKIFAGLQAPEAEKILCAMEKLGVHLVRDPEMAAMVAKTLAERRGWTGQA